MNYKRDLKTIAIFRTDRIGEVVLSTVAVDILKKKFPQASIIFFTSEYSAPILSNREDVDEVVKLKPFDKGKIFRQAWNLAKIIKDRNCDMIFVLNTHKVIHLAGFLARVPLRYGYDRKWGGLLTHRVKDRRDEAKKHELEYNWTFFQELDLLSEKAQPALHIQEGMVEMVRDVLDEHGLDQKKPLIVIHPCASNFLKCWSREKYVELIRQLSQFHCQLILVGEEKEYDAIADIIVDSGCKAVNAAGLFRLEELAALLKISRLFIGNDSGPMHMAAALGTPVIAIFSKKALGSNPLRWRPWGDGHVIFHELYGEKPCQLKNFSGYYVAKDSINSQDVLDLLEIYL